MFLCSSVTLGPQAQIYTLYVFEDLRPDQFISAGARWRLTWCNNLLWQLKSAVPALMWERHWTRRCELICTLLHFIQPGASSWKLAWHAWFCWVALWPEVLFKGPWGQGGRTGLDPAPAYDDTFSSSMLKSKGMRVLTFLDIFDWRES